MTKNSEIRKTTKMVYFVAMIKEKEISLYERKVLELQELMLMYPNNPVNEHKFNLAKLRLDQLKKTAKGLRRLEQKIVNLENKQAS